MRRSAAQSVAVALYVLFVQLPAAAGLAALNTAPRRQHLAQWPRRSSPLVMATSAKEEAKMYHRQVRKETLLFAGPALATVLADPLMSVVDATCVGRMCSTLQLASLGPSLTVFNFANYFFYFLNAATAVLVTQSLACSDEAGAADTLAAAVFLAVVCGIAASALLIGLAPMLVASTGCVAELIPAAVLYLRVRAIGQPIVLSSMVIQASLLAQLDVLTPLQVVLASCALNVVCDILWVPMLGAVGAAWATLLSQALALPLMLWLAARRGRLPVRLRFARIAELRTFFSTAAPLFFFEVGMSTCYALIQSLSTQFTVAAAAAFQALWSPLQVLCFMTYPLKQAAQVFLPRILAIDTAESIDAPPQSDGDGTSGAAACEVAGPTVGGEPKSKILLTVLAQLSCVTGVALAAIGVCLAKSPFLFTSDPALWPVIASFAPYVALPLLLLGFAQVLEGVLLGTGDLSFLSLSQLGNVLTAFAFVSLTKTLGMDVHGTWVVFAAFIASRFTQSSVRVFFQRKPWEQVTQCEVPPAPAS